MSFRSPTPDGLLVSPNAPGNVNNPAATPQELQSHHYWGRYSLITQLPNVGTVDGVAVIGVNPAAVPAYDKMAPGDLGYAQGTNRIYVLVDRGTVGGNDAVWESLNAVSTLVQTVRDAHVIVVGESGYLATLGGVAIPPLATNSLNLSAVTGDQLGITVDYLDPGDGSELQLALAAAAAAGVAIDIRLRPCDISLTPATVGANGFLVPAICRLLGAGQSLSILRGTSSAGVTQTVVTLAQNATLEDISVVSPAPAGAPGGAQLGVVQCTGVSTRILGCSVGLEASLTVDRVSIAAIFSALPGSEFLVSDCALSVDSLFVQTTPVESYGVLLGTTVSASAARRDWEVRDTWVDEFTPTRGSAASAVTSRNVEGGRVFNVEHVNALTPITASILWGWSFASVNGTFRGPRIIGNRISITSDQNRDAGGIAVAIGGALTLDAEGIYNVEIHDNEIDFAFLLNPNPTISKTGIRVANGSTDGALIQNVSIDGNKIRGHNRGIVLDASGPGNTGAIRSVRTTGNQARNSIDGNAPDPVGMLLRASPTGSVSNAGTVNNDFSGVNFATGAGIEIEDALVVDSIVLANNLTPGNLGSALIDNGTGTEAAHNIL